jgi:CHAT domain-containing protein/tetratricopeptide (TPR) repeat protein
MSNLETIPDSLNEEAQQSDGLDGHVGLARRCTMMDHMAHSGDHQSLVLAASKEMAVETKIAQPGWVTASRGWKAATSIVIISVAASVIPSLRDRLLQRQPGIEDVVKASEPLPFRSIDGRLTGGYPYRRMRGAVRGDSQKEELGLAVATHRFVSAVQSHPTVVNRQALAAVDLLRGRPDDGVRALEMLVRETTGKRDLAAAIEAASDATIVGDLSAAYLARAASENRSSDLTLAFTAADRAWVLRKIPETAWNRAVALETIGLQQDAVEAWRQYLIVDPASEWSIEARKRLATLQLISVVPDRDRQIARLRLAAAGSDVSAVADVVAAGPRLSRTYVEDELLRAWANATDKQSADDSLAAAAVIGAALARATGDLLVTNTVVRIKRLSAEGGKPIEVVRAAIRSLDRAAQLSKSGDTTRALSEFQTAENELRGVQCPLVHSVRVQEVLALFQANEFNQALSRIDRMRGDLKGTLDYPSIEARIGWLAGMCLVEIGRPYEALDRYENALVAAGRGQDRDSQSGLHALIAQNLELLGRGESAWAHRQQAFRLAETCENRQRMQYVLAEAMASAVENDRIALAKLLSDRITAIDPHGLNIALNIGSVAWRARHWAASGHTEEAAADIGTAKRLLSTVIDTGTRNRARAVIDLAEGTILVRRAPARSVADLTAAREFFRRSADSVQLTQLFASRATAYASLGEFDRARSDIRAGIEEVERQRATGADPGERAAFLEAQQSLFDGAVRLALHDGDREEAFRFAERSRARTLTDRLGDGAAHPADPPTVAALQARLDRDTSLLEFYVLDEKLLLWVVRSDSFELREIGLDAEAVSALVADVVRAGEKQEPAAFREAVARAGRLLLEPAAPWIRASRRLVIVPDRGLMRLPFSSLSWEHRYLFETHEVTLSPSATVGEHLLRPHPRDEGSLRVAAFLSPTFSNRLFPDLPRLDAVRDEGRSLARAFAGAAIREGRDVDASAFLAALDDYDVIHFAGHAVQNGNPDLAALLLADDPSRKGIVYAHDIRSVKAKRTRLVVLSACETARAASAGRDADLPLTYAFLVAGVPSVIGSLWSVDDRASADLMARFYVHLAEGQTSGAALRSAKLDLLARSNHSNDYPAWVAFELLGAEKN